MRRTFSAKPDKNNKAWMLIDANGKILGRLATQIATYLRGKNNPCYTPHIDTGSYIIVINARKIVVTGRKQKNKIYYHHTGYIGGLKSITFNKLLDKSPERIIEKAVKGMLPKNHLGREMYKKLKIYSDEFHPHTAQNPKNLDHI